MGMARMRTVSDRFEQVRRCSNGARPGRRPRPGSRRRARSSACCAGNSSSSSASMRSSAASAHSLRAFSSASMRSSAASAHSLRAFSSASTFSSSVNARPPVPCIHCDRLSLSACDLFENRCGGRSVPHPIREARHRRGEDPRRVLLWRPLPPLCAHRVHGT